MKYADIAAVKYLENPPRNSSLLTFREGQENYPLIVHSHLRWDWVWQRPQQFLSRLSKKHRILFVEAPIPSDELRQGRAMLREVTDYPNIVVLQIQMPAARWNNGPWVDKERRRLVQSVLGGPVGAAFKAPVQWFYDPMAVTAFAGHMDERAIVYDCMDELSLFRGAPAELVRRERELLAMADIVFAGGPKIGRAKRRLNPNCFVFGCGVDARHFSQARVSGFPIAPDIVGLPRPIYGYIGVIDERIDYELIAALSAANSGSIVMVGPSTKVDPANFPQRKNLHWLGGRDYADLPRYASGFDVCMMPFALNEATQFINPTKTLEYLAAGKPVVSTPIEDVVSQFRNVVSIGASHEEFIAKCFQSSIRPDRHTIERGLAMVHRNSWESIVRQIEKHIDDVLASKRSLDTHAA